nr:unnamed protein product [Haemonchus contortus]
MEVCIAFQSFHANCNERVFAFVLVAVILGATSSWEDPYLKEVHVYMEVVLAVFFVCEFCVRMWCISADAKYCGMKGK